MPLTSADVEQARKDFVAIKGEKAAEDYERVYGDSDASLYLAFREAIRDAEENPTPTAHKPTITHSDFASFAAKNGADIYKRVNKNPAKPMDLNTIPRLGNDD